MKGYRGKLMKKWLIFGLLLIVPHTLWLGEAQLEQNGSLRRITSAPLVGIEKQPEKDSDDLELRSPMSPSLTMSPTSPPVTGMRLVRKTSDHKRPAKYPEDRYELVGYYQREDWTDAPLYRLKDPKK